MGQKMLEATHSACRGRIQAELYVPGSHSACPADVPLEKGKSQLLKRALKQTVKSKAKKGRTQAENSLGEYDVLKFRLQWLYLPVTSQPLSCRRKRVLLPVTS